MAEGLAKLSTYFRAGGRHCTEDTLRLAIARSKDLGLSFLVVASTSGFTALKAVELTTQMAFSGQLVVVGEHYGYDQPGRQDMSEEVLAELKARGVAVFFGTHALSSVSRSFRTRWGGLGMLEIVAEVLRRFSRGIKAAVESAIMAADAGLIPVDQDVVAVAGSGVGADSAIVLRPAHSNGFFDLKIREIIAMPRYRENECVEPVIRLHEQGVSPGEIARRTGEEVEIVENYVNDFEEIKRLYGQGLSTGQIAAHLGKGTNTTEMYLELLK